MTIIKWEQSQVIETTYRTQKFGNLLGDTYQGEVNKYGEFWSGWLTNHSNSDRTEFRVGFKSRAAATRWVNKQLKGILR